MGADLTPQQLIVVGILITALVLFVTNWLRFDLVAILILVLLVLPSLFGYELLRPDDVLKGFSNEAIPVLACLFVITRSLQKTGLSDTVALQLRRIAGKNERRMFFILLMLAGSLSAFVNDIAVTAMTIPMVLRCYDRLGVSPSRVYLPLAYMSLVGGVMTLIGTSTNLVVSGELRRLYALPAIGMFEMFPAGVFFFIAAAAALYLYKRIFARGEDEESLFKKYNVKEFLSEILVKAGSEVTGRPLQDLHFGRDYDITVIGVVREGKTLFSPPPTLVIKGGDVLMVQGGVENIISLRKEKRLELLNELKVEENTLRTIDLMMAETVLLPNCDFIGRSIREVDLRDTYGVTVLALSRGGLKMINNLADIPLAMGDTLLIQGHATGVDRLQRHPNLLVLETIDRPLSHRKLPISLLVVVAMVAAAAIMPDLIYFNCLLAVLLLLGARCITLNDVYEAVDWRILVLIGGLLPLGQAVKESGVLMHLLPLLPKDQPYLVMVLLYLITFALTQVISNTATAALMLPFAVDLANGLDVNYRPFVFAITFASSFAILTPVGHQACTLVMGPGNYRVGDYLRMGSFLGLVLFLVFLWAIPFFFPFHGG